MLGVESTTCDFKASVFDEWEAQLIQLESLPQPRARVAPTDLVKLCYTLIHAGEAAGVRDLADGEFRPEDTCLEDGIRRQLNYLLDQVGCNRPGFRLLEIGCGYGTLLQEAEKRGAAVVGVNISPEQVEFCRRQGSNVYCCTYRDLLNTPDWYGKFDGVIANGSLEHWVQPEDVIEGRMNRIYRESFRIAEKMLDPDLPEARYVTTAIHTPAQMRPEDLLKPWYRQPKATAQRHFSLLHHWMGGYYPVEGQLETSAAPYFSLVDEMDGTLGYKIANDFRMVTLKKALRSNPRAIARLTRALLRHPWVTATMYQCFFREKSWDWQFQGDSPPTKLLRQTWQVNRWE
jgi:cyclopropane-fatty-acyl-phospholipid synthase